MVQKEVKEVRQIVCGKYVNECIYYTCILILRGLLLFLVVRTTNVCFIFFAQKFIIYYNILYEYIIERESLLFHLYLYVYKWNK